MKLHKIATLALAGLMVLALAGCGAPATETKTETPSTTPAEKPAEDKGVAGGVTVEGSDTLVKMSASWAEEVTEVHPDLMVSVKGGGSGVGIAALVNGTVDFATASREIKDSEVEALKAAGKEVTEHEVAKDGIAVITNKNNAVAGLTAAQLKDIYMGTITNWKDVGGADKAIVVVSRDSASGTYEFFKEHIVGKDNEMAPSTILLASNQAILDEVGKNDAAIGFCGVGYANDTVKIIELDGVAASVASVMDGSYELSRGLYMYSAGDLTPAMQAFLDFVMSPAGQKIVEDEGFVPVN